MDASVSANIKDGTVTCKSVGVRILTKMVKYQDVGQGIDN